MTPSPPSAFDKLREIERVKQCPMRRNGQCELLNQSLGWAHGLPLSDCDQCWSRGGQHSGDAKQWRDQHAASLIAHFSSRMRSLPREVVLALLDRLPPSRSEELLKDPEVRWALDKPSPVKMAASFAKSLASRGLFNHRVELTVKNQRLTSCFGSPDQPSCPALQVSHDQYHHFCRDCGCGDNERSWLDAQPYSKLDYPYLECPRSRPGFSNAS